MKVRGEDNFRCTITKLKGREVKGLYLQHSQSCVAIYWLYVCWFWMLFNVFPVKNMI